MQNRPAIDERHKRGGSESAVVSSEQADIVAPTLLDAIRQISIVRPFVKGNGRA